VRIHHLNCGSLCPRGGKLFGGAGGPLSAAPMCCHCLLIEGEDGLILVDSGLGVDDVNEPRRLGFLFNAMARPRLDVAETALRQVADLGHRPSDVRHIVPTHLDLDHAGGICDFPDAAVHVFAAELRAASHRSSLRERSRYRAVQIAAVTKWAPIEEDGESWFGFSAVRAIPGTRDEVLLVPLPGHSRGHCGVAVRREDDWLLHCGDAYFHHSEVEPVFGPTPRGLRFFESMVQFDGAQRRANQLRLRELARLSGGEVKLICSHDSSDIFSMKSAQREAQAAQQPIATPQPVSPPQPVQQRDLRARRNRPA
jgi:glyoxylase-like metal-dependent hydrolase (beta-lactamase superfamily II)